MKMIGKYLQAVSTSDPVKRVRRFYEIIPSSSEFIDRSTTYCNFGYWQDGCTNLDEAAQALAGLLADSAGFKPGDTILDAGFGYGEQDFFWLRERDPSHIHGLNITPHQIEAATRRAKREGVADKVDFRQGSATEMPFESNSFDRVVALESAFHFYPRSKFFEEAFRVLRPGGTLAVADVLPAGEDVVRKNLRSRPLSWILIGFDEENWYTGDVYARELASAGFTEPRIESIRDKVWEPWRQYMVNRLEDPSYQRKLGKSQHQGLSRNWSDQPLLKQELETLDYVIAVAQKPADA